MPLLLELRKTLGTDVKMRKQAYDLVKTFVVEYENEFQDVAILNRKHATAMMKRACVWCGEDSHKLEELIRFTLGNWDKIKAELKLTGRPTIGLFGSAVLFQRLKDFAEFGFSEKTSGVKERFVKDDSPVSGW